jgi:hypothetical protein
MVVERHELVPPVDIRSLCSVYADVREVNWPHVEVDALVHGLSGRRPEILLRAATRIRRKRFTIGHELGHVLIPWHLEDIACTPDYEILDVANFGNEEQANIFSSCLLLPDRWMGELIVANGESMGEILHELNAAEVSAMAALLALRRNLFAGWGFCAVQTEGSSVVLSPGTRLDNDPGISRLEMLRRDSLDCGSVIIQGTNVEWFRLREVAEMPVYQDEELAPRQALREALAEYCGSAEEQRKLEMSLNGKIGGILRSASGRPARELFATVEYRLQHDGFSGLLVLPEFRAWLASKAEAIERGETKRRQQKTVSVRRY